jgi:hypothetical protein
MSGGQGYGGGQPQGYGQQQGYGRRPSWPGAYGQQQMWQGQQPSQGIFQQFTGPWPGLRGFGERQGRPNWNPDPAGKGAPPQAGVPGQMYTGGTPGFYGNPVLPPSGAVTQQPDTTGKGAPPQQAPGMWTGGTPGFYGNPVLPPAGYVTQPGQAMYAGGPASGGYQLNPGQGLLVDPREATPPPGTYYGRRYP